MIRSMTGFGAADGVVGSARVSVEVRTVNHRFFNPNLKLPSAFSRWEGEVREILRREIARGHVTLVARVERNAETGISVNEEKFAETVRLLRRLQEQHGLDDSLDVATVLRMPDLMTGDRPDEIEGTVEELGAIVSAAASALTAMREAEGERLTLVLEERIALIEQALGRLAARAPERLVSERERLRRSVSELAAGVAIDEQRLAQEIAILADKLDVSEEMDRFRSHIAGFRETIRGRGEKKESVGKRLGFLLQEMVREANTTGSKARDAVLLREVVAIKEELERLAEQVENVE